MAETILDAISEFLGQRRAAAQQMPTQRNGLAAAPAQPRAPIVPVAPTQSPAQNQNPNNRIMQYLNGGNADGSWRNRIRAFAAGAGGGRPTGGDPFLAFGQGFGGAQGYYDNRDASKAAAAAEREKMMYERGVDQREFAMDERRFKADRADSSADLALRRAAAERQAERDRLANRKSAVEIERLAKQNGLTIDQALEIERIAQAAGENEPNPSKRRAVIEQERKRLIEQYGGGETKPDGLSKGSPLAPPREGQEMDGYRFKGGDPNDQANWEPV